MDIINKKNPAEKRKIKRNFADPEIKRRRLKALIKEILSKPPRSRNGDSVIVIMSFN
jgi:hypothetical protein